MILNVMDSFKDLTTHGCKNLNKKDKWFYRFNWCMWNCS